MNIHGKGLNPFFVRSSFQTQENETITPDVFRS